MPEDFKNNMSNPFIWARVYAIYEAETLKAYWPEFREKTFSWQIYLSKRKWFGMGLVTDYYYKYKSSYIPLFVLEPNFSFASVIKPV